jgi:hypothetical protein
MMNEWDPLSLDANINTDILATAKKREIKNILKSYVGFFDPFAELIQNAMDAVDRRKEEEADFEKRIWIEINLDENSLVVTDNGIGFQESQLKHFLAPNISFKSGGMTRGNKGVGATYLAYGFNYLSFETRSKSYSASGEIKDGRNWVEDTDGVISRPLIQIMDSQPRMSSVDYGTSFLLKFGGEHSRPKNLSWLAATSAKQWRYLLLGKTPLGLVKNAAENSDIKFNIKVIQKSVVDELTDQDAIYVYPHIELPHSQRFSEIISAQGEAVAKGKDVQQAMIKYQKKNGLFDDFNTNEITDLVKEDDLKAVIKKYSITAYGYFGYSTDLWDLLNDKIADLRSGYRFIKGGLQIANNNMIQGDPITIPLTSNIGYQNQCHIVIHLVGADPDLGRKGFQPEVKLACEKIAVAIVNRLKLWRKALKTNSGAAIVTEKATRLHDWIKTQEDHETNSGLNLLNKNFFKPTNEISIVSSPQSEQDVIVLFNQLIAGGVIRGIILLATSQSEQYDGVFRFITKTPPANYLYDANNNPLGLDHVKAHAVTKSRPYILEYKYSIDGLMADFENGEKIASDIEMIVAWESGEQWKKDWEMTSLLIDENSNQRDFHGLTHLLYNAGATIKVILLKDLIEFLNDASASKKTQEVRYETE